MTLLGPAIALLFAALTRAPCPHGVSDPVRATLVRSLVVGTPDGTRLARLASPPPICFADGEGGLLEGTAILPQGSSAAVQAARLAHVWQHAIDGGPHATPAPGQTCEAWLADTTRLEARADSVEASVAAALRVSPIDHASRNTAYKARCR